jgi:hypothetical protein
MCIDEGEAVRLQRALISATTGYAVESPAVQITADLVLRVAGVLVRLPPRYTGQVLIDYNQGAARIRQTQDVQVERDGT